MRRAIFIGRFQPFHRGHRQVVEAIADRVDELVVGIGSAGDSHTANDPFTGGERIMMITKALMDLDLVTYAVPIEDLDRNSVWVSHVQSMSPRFDVAYSNNPLVVRLFEESNVPVEQVPMVDRHRYEGAEVRRRMIADDGWEELVPAEVVEVVTEIDGIARLQQVARTDESSS